MIDKSSRIRVSEENFAASRRRRHGTEAGKPVLVYCSFASSRRGGQGILRAQAPLLMGPTSSTIDVAGVGKGPHLPWILSVVSSVPRPLG